MDENIDKKNRRVVKNQTAEKNNTMKTNKVTEAAREVAKDILEVFVRTHV